jgi:hypothetical protein
VNTRIVKGTSCRFSSTRRAVTTMTSDAVGSALVADVCANAGVAIIAKVRVVNDVLSSNARLK